MHLLTPAGWPRVRSGIGVRKATVCCLSACPSVTSVSMVAVSHRPTRHDSTVQLRRVGDGRCEQDDYFERVRTPADCLRFNSHRPT